MRIIYHTSMPNGVYIVVFVCSNSFDNENCAREKYIMYVPKYPNFQSVPEILFASLMKNKVYLNKNNIDSTTHDLHCTNTRTKALA